MLKQNGDILGAVDVYSKYPIKSDQDEKTQDQKQNIGFMSKIFKISKHYKKYGNLIIFTKI
jgi:hypothetical protein